MATFKEIIDAFVTKTANTTANRASNINNIQNAFSMLNSDHLKVNVKDYGATGNGTTNDYTAINSAITALSGSGDLYCPKATAYRIASNLTMANGIQYVPEQGAMISVDGIAISNITKANPGIVTTLTAHGFSNGDAMRGKDIGGMVELNYSTNGGVEKTVTYIDATHFSIGDTSGYTPYTSGGYAQHILTINGTIDAGLYQIFAGNGAVAFGSGSIKEAYPEWWGVDGTADEIEINRALDAYSWVRLLKKTYTTSGPITIKTGNILSGGGRTATTISPNAQTFAAITITGTVTQWQIHNININYGVATGGARASNANAVAFKVMTSGGGFPSYFSINDVSVFYAYRGFYVEDLAFQYSLTNVYISEAGNYGVYLDNPTSATTVIFNNVFVNGATVGGFWVRAVDGLVMNACASDHADKGGSINLFTSCRVTINGFFAEGNVLGNGCGVMMFSDCLANLNNYKGANTYDEAAGQESYGIRASDTSKLIVTGSTTYGETHTGAGTAFAAIAATGTSQMVIMSSSIGTPTGGGAYGIYTGNNLVTVWNSQEIDQFGNLIIFGKLGIDTSSPTNSLSFSGNSAKTIWMERHSVGGSPGNSLTIQAGSSTIWANDQPGGSLILNSGPGTGSGTPSKVILASPVQGTAVASSTQELVPRAILNQVVPALSSGVPATVLTLICAAGTMVGGTIHFTIEGTDGTEMIAASGEVSYALVNKAGVYTGNTSATTIAKARSDAVNDDISLSWTFANNALQVTSTLTHMTATIHRLTCTVISNSQQSIS